MAIYYLPKPWTGRNDGTDFDVQRWHQHIHCIDINVLHTFKTTNKKVALLGFCSDEGVRRNHGRTGAKDGPAAIRKACSSLSTHTTNIQLLDTGDVVCDDNNLESAQAMLAEKIAILIQNNCFPIVLGGGHEVAYANFSGIPKQQGHFGVINFDAHFDLRPVEPHTGATSGTGFWQMAQVLQQQFQYLAIGIQQCSNTKKLFQIAKDIGAVYATADQCNIEYKIFLIQLLDAFLQKTSAIQLSIDMDVFAAASAPGVSAPAYNGIAPNEVVFKHLLQHILLSGKVASIDIAEVNPVYDIDHRTAKLAAAFIFDIIQILDNNNLFI